MGTVRHSPTAAAAASTPCIRNAAVHAVHAAETKAYKAYARWSWQRDDGTFEEYDGVTNAKIEKAYVQFRESGFHTSTPAGAGAGAGARAGAGAGAGAGAASPPHHLHGTNAVTVSTSPHRIVTFTRMHQVNADTGFARAIRRQTQHESVPVPLLLLLLLPRELSNARGYLMVCLLRFPFPDTWPTHSDNCMLVDVAGDSEEWNRAATLLTASVTDATLVQLQRYAVCV